MSRPRSISAADAIARVLAALALVAALAASAQTVDAERANQVKAAYLVNFLRYTEWPASTFPERDSPFVIMVAGSDALAAAVEALARAAGRVEGRRVEVHRVQLPPAGVAGSALRAELAERLRHSHLLYIESSQADRADDLLALVRDFPVLTVGDADRFASGGGMLELLQRGPNIVLAANPVAIRRSDLSVSAKVLKLAELVGQELP